MMTQAMTPAGMVYSKYAGQAQPVPPASQGTPYGSYAGWLQSGRPDSGAEAWRDMGSPRGGRPPSSPQGQPTGGAFSAYNQSPQGSAYTAWQQPQWTPQRFQQPMYGTNQYGAGFWQQPSPWGNPFQQPAFRQPQAAPQPMMQQGWQTPSAPQVLGFPSGSPRGGRPPSRADSVRDLFAQSNIQIPPGFLDQLLGMLGQQSPATAYQSPPQNQSPAPPSPPAPAAPPASPPPATAATATDPYRDVSRLERERGSLANLADVSSNQRALIEARRSAESLTANPQSQGMVSLRPLGTGNDAIGNSLSWADYAVRPDEAEQFRALNLGTVRRTDRAGRARLFGHAEQVLRNPGQHTAGYMQALKTALQFSGSTMVPHSNTRGGGTNPDAKEYQRKSQLMEALTARINGQDAVVRDAISNKMRRSGFNQAPTDVLQRLGLGVTYRNRP